MWLAGQQKHFDQHRPYVLVHVLCCCQVRWLLHYVRGLVMHYMAAVQHVLGNREAQADCYHAQVRVRSLQCSCE